MADIWFDVDTALSEVPINKFPLTDDTDFKSREESVVYNQSGLDLVWNFVTTAGAMTQTAVTPTDTGGNYDFVNQGNGMYSIEIPASGGASINNDTEGFGWFTGLATGILPWISPIFGFRAAGLNDLLIDNAYSTTRGLAGTALPAAAADAAGGLPISDAGGLDVDAIKTQTDKLAHADYGIDKLVRSTTPANTLTVDASHRALSDLASILGTALTETAGQIAAAFKKFFDKATPTGTINSLPDAVAGANGGIPTTNGTKINQTVDLTAGQSIAASSVPDVTLATLQPNYTPAKAGDKMDLVDAPNATAVGVIQSGLATLSKMLKYFQLMFRKDAAIKSDNSTEFAAINADGGSGAGSYDNVTDSVQALRDDLPVEVEQHIINETDGEAVLTAITNKIASVNPDLSGLTLEAIADAVRTELATELAHLNADVTSRSSHSAADVWAVATRTLTAFGFTVATNSDGAIVLIQAQTDKIGDASKGLVKIYDDMAKDATVSKPGTAQTITPPADMALNSTVMKAASYTAPDNTNIANIYNLIKASGDGDAAAMLLILNALATMYETDGAVKRFTANALEEAPTAKNTAEEIREAIGLESANLDSQLAALPTAAENADAVCDELVADHTVAGSVGKILGSYLPDAGSGSVNYIYTLTNADTGVAIPGADIRVSTDAAGTTIIASGTTNTSGQVTFLLDPGTYYFWRTKTGWTFTDPDVEIVSL